MEGVFCFVVGGLGEVEEILLFRLEFRVTKVGVGVMVVYI